MTTYLLTYDLHHEPREVYATLIEGLEKGGARRVQESVWCIDSTWNALEIYKWAARNLRRGDELVVAEINKQNTVATKDSRSWRGVFIDLTRIQRRVAAAIQKVRFTNLVRR